MDCIGVAADTKSSVIKQLPKLLFSMLLNVLLFIILLRVALSMYRKHQRVAIPNHGFSHFYDNARLVYLILKK